MFRSASRQFRYWDPAKASLAGGAEGASDRPEMLTMSIAEYVAVAEAIAAGTPGTSPHYLQTTLVEGVGEEMLAQFRSFDWTVSRLPQTRPHAHAHAHMHMRTANRRARGLTPTRAQSPRPIPPMALGHDGSTPAGLTG